MRKRKGGAAPQARYRNSKKRAAAAPGTQDLAAIPVEAQDLAAIPVEAQDLAALPVEVSLRS